MDNVDWARDRAVADGQLWLPRRARGPTVRRPDAN
jgi:hypothetical protein